MVAWRIGAGLAIGASVALVSPLAFAQRAAPAARVDVAQGQDYTRFAFRFTGAAVSVTPTRDGDRLDLVFSRAIDLDIAEIRSTPPRHVRDVSRTTRPDGRLALSLQLDPGVRHRQFSEAGAIVVDLLPPSTEAPPPATLAGPVQVRESRDATEISVTWSRQVRAAIVQRGEAAWMVFDTPARLDLRGARRSGRFHAGLSVVDAPESTALRIALNAEARVSARAEGGAWIVRIADAATPRDAVATRRDLGPDGRGRLLAAFERDGVVRTIRDPVLGDTFVLGLLDGMPRGVDAQRAAPEAVLMPSAHGALVDLRKDDVAVRFEAGNLIVSEGERIVTPITVEYTPREPSLGAASRIAFADAWAVPMDLVLERKAQLERLAADEGMARGASTRARMELARFLVAHELSVEALGALSAATVNQPQMAYDPTYRLLRGIASAMLGRTKDAEADLAAGALVSDPVAALWRGYVAANNGAWEAAQRNLERGRDALPSQTPALRARFLTALARAAIENRDLSAAAAAARAAEAEAPTKIEQQRARLYGAIVLRLAGQAKEALPILEDVQTTRDEQISAHAALEAVRAKRALGELTPEAAAEALEGLRFRWRGDGLELAINQALGALHVETGRWRDGLDVMRASANRFPNHPLGRQMRVDMSALFESLFIDGEATKLDPVQALGLFYDFRELTPIGPNGDRMVRSLAGRLVALDLLQQASDLLKYQVENRLDGMAKASIASDLALIYIQDGKPEQAVQAIASTRQPRLPAALVSERRLLEARAQAMLGRTGIARELIEREQSADARRLRADIAWREKDWARAGAELRAIAAALPKDKPLEDSDRGVVLRAGMAAVFADDRASRQALRRDYAALMQDTPDAAAFDLVTGDVEIEGVALRDLAQQIAQSDLMDRFMQSMRARLTGGAQTAANQTAPAAATPTTPPA